MAADSVPRGLCYKTLRTEPCLQHGTERGMGTVCGQQPAMVPQAESPVLT